MSWLTVLALIPIVPTLLAMPGLSAANAKLQSEVAERRAAEARASEATSRAERYLADSVRAEQRAHRMVEAAPSAMIAVDSAGQILLVNSHAASLFDYPRESLVGQSVETLIPERLRAEHIAMRTEFFFKPEVRAMGAGRDLFGRRRDGSEFSIEIGLNPVETPDGPIVISAIIDITERKAAEALLRRTITELADTNRELEQFAYMASHDLQEPLRKVVSFASLLEEDMGEALPEAAASDLHFITDAAMRMQALVKGLLDLSRASRGERQLTTVALDACVEAALDALDERIEETGAQIERVPLPCVEGHQPLLMALYQNLLGNALKFVAAGATPRVRITATRDGDVWTFGVADEGIGIDAKYADTIWEPFRRLHGRLEYEGTGIGLAICKKAVERHGGRIWIESTPGRGSTFLFTLANVVAAGSTPTAPAAPLKA